MIIQPIVVNFIATNITHSLILIICLLDNFSLECHNNLRDNTGHLVHCTMISVFGKVKKKKKRKKVILMRVPKDSFKKYYFKVRGLGKHCFTAIKRLTSKHENIVDCNMVQK